MGIHLVEWCPGLYIFTLGIEIISFSLTGYVNYEY